MQRQGDVWYPGLGESRGMGRRNRAAGGERKLRERGRAFVDRRMAAHKYDEPAIIHAESGEGERPCAIR